MMEDIVAGNVKNVMGEHSTGRVDMYMVRVDSIKIRPGFNAAREADPEHDDHIREIADSMKANGFQRHKPLKVAAAHDGSLFLSDGHMRYEAVLLANSEGAGIQSVPVVNEVKGTSEEDRIVGLVIDNNGRRLTPYGEGIVCKTLMGRGLDEKQIAKRLGFNPQKVQNLLELVAAPKAIQDMVVSGRVSSTLAIETLKKDGATAVATLEAAKAVADASGKSKVMKKHVKKTKETPAVPEAPAITPQAAIAAFASANAIREAKKPKLPDVATIRSNMSEQHRNAISPAAVQIVLDALLQSM